MRKWIWATVAALPLAVVSGLVYANTNAKTEKQAGGFVCPITGEELPCPNCCTLNQGK